jgi:hypothetical protein
MSLMLIIHWSIRGKTLKVLPSPLHREALQGKQIMTAITSGTYGHQPLFSGAIRQLAAALFSSRPAAKTHAGDAAATSSPLANTFRVRVREANDVRELARSVEHHSPGFAADLYAAASRHEGYDD